jgi:hypothetical protein
MKHKSIFTESAMDEKQIKAEEASQRDRAERTRRWEMACRAVRSGLVAADKIPLDPAWIETRMQTGCNRETAVQQLREYLSGDVPQHIEISEASAAAIDRAHQHDLEHEFWRTLDVRLRESEREYP